MYIFHAYMKTRDYFRKTYQGLNDKTNTFFYKLLLYQLLLWHTFSESLMFCDQFHEHLEEQDKGNKGNNKVI